MSYNKALDMEFLGPRLWVIDIMIHIIPEKAKYIPTLIKYEEMFIIIKKYKLHQNFLI